MASAQVLPNASRKQEHLEAGKRRLEEFRKKSRAKKTSSNGQPSDANAKIHEKKPLDIDHVRETDFDGVATSGVTNKATGEPKDTGANNDNIVNDVKNSDPSASRNLQAETTKSLNDNNAVYRDQSLKSAGDQVVVRFDTSSDAAEANFDEHARYLNDKSASYTASQANLSHAGADKESSAYHESAYDANIYTSKSGYDWMGNTQSKQYHTSNDFSFPNSGASHVSTANVSSEESGSFLPQNMHAYARGTDSHNPPMFYKGLGGGGSGAYKDVNSDVNGPVIYDTRDTLNSSISNSINLYGASVQPSSFNLESKSSPDHAQLESTMAETNPRRFRPSFLDSLNISRASNSPSRIEQEKPLSYASSTFGAPRSDVQTSLQKPFQDSMLTSSELRIPNGPTVSEPSMSSTFNTNGADQMKADKDLSMDGRHEFHSRKHDDDFFALEQHIEDLTQEKFSLQRALEASRTLAESLAAENSALTDNYNQQGGIVNQLRSDMARLQEEIKAQLVELDSIRGGYANAQLECNAADERAKLLASEVIGLEEKALRLRSSELKLERHLEKSQAEIISFKKKVSSLERERQDLQSTIDALQEEKKLLQSKFRKTSVSGMSFDFGKTPGTRKEASTSTEDLIYEDNTHADASNLEMHSLASPYGGDISSLTLLQGSGLFSLEASSLSIPSDQMRMIQNINTLISELAVEKEELMRALATESSSSCELKELNKELSRKLEHQTQRLELLTAQSMAAENISGKLPDSQTMQENTTYADEGDEVVERVLGWIMKLFPGGPSRRRTSKLL